MVVWSEQEATARAVTDRGRRRRNGLVATVAATLMLLVGLVSPVGALAPDAPTGVTPTATGQTVSVSFTAGALNGSTLTDHTVTLDPAGAGANITQSGPGSPISFTSVPVGTYDVTVVTDSSDGPSPASVAVPVTVAAVATAPGAPTIGAASRVGTTTSATVAWTPPGSNGGSAITRYEVQVDGVGGWSSVGTTSPGTVTGLAFGSHTFKVRAVNAVGPSGASAASNAVDITLPLPGTPGTPSVSNSGSTINVSWGAASGTVVDYLVELDRSGQATQTRTPTGTSTSFAGQSPGEYTITVTARNGTGSGLSANKQYTLTLAASAVRNVSAAVDSSNRAVITWDPPADDGGGVGQYRISLSPAAAGPTTVSGTTQETSFSGLASGNYTVSVVALNAAGTGAAGTDTFSIVVAPGSPLNVKTSAASTTDGTATVTWDPPANNGNGTISAYVVELGGKTITVAATAARSASFTGLPIGKLTATVVAVNAQGNSAAGSSPEFRSNRPVHPFTTREAFVRQAFQDLFDVAPTAAEQATWAQSTAANGSNAPAVITSLMQSNRFETRRQVSRLYFAYFLRVPDAQGQNYWADLMDRGVLDLQGVSDEFARSQEFINTYGGLTDPEFLVVVYNNVLLRTPDLIGFNYWLGERNKGLTRGGVMTWFTEGSEFITLSLPAIDTSLAHITLLDRSPTSGEYALWFTRMRDSSDSLETLVGSIWTSDEYAARITPN